ncbi:MAG: SIS domain-containing protein [Sphingomicrobium sp.]
MASLAPAGDMTLMEREAAESARAVERMLVANQEGFRAIAERLRESQPTSVITCARGSSDHAATYAKYLIETRIGIPVASAALSVSSIYNAAVSPGNRVCLAISQSGRSPDLLAAVAEHRRSGAFVIALVNAEGAPLSDTADVTIALDAGPEHSVAATKSYICSLAAIAALVGTWAQDAEMLEAVNKLPEQLEAAWQLDWSPAVGAFVDADNLFVVARGYGYGIAQEAALKLKETCAMHAESFSAAEVRHGPMAIVGHSFNVLALGGSDLAGQSVRKAAEEFRKRGANLLIADTDPGIADLPAIAAHPVIEPILMIASFYRMANALSLARGCDPDRPPHLNKVTETL